MNGEYDPELVSIRRYRTDDGSFAFDILYGDGIVGEITREGDDYRMPGHPWNVTLFISMGDLTKCTNTVNMAWVKAIARTELEANLFRIVSRPLPKRYIVEQQRLAIRYPGMRLRRGRGKPTLRSDIYIVHIVDGAGNLLRSNAGYAYDIRFEKARGGAIIKSVTEGLGTVDEAITARGKAIAEFAHEAEWSPIY